MNHSIRLILFAIVACLQAMAGEKPNILIIYADDVGLGDLGCYGADAIDTPNLDALAKRGIRFTSAYSSSSTCTPSRYSLLTGEYAFRNQRALILPGNAPLIIDPSKPTLASILHDHGYKTGLVGKWHLGLGLRTEPLDWNGDIAPGPRELGFDYSFHMAATGDRVPTVYIENGRIVNHDPKDPVRVSYLDPVGDDPTGISHPHLLRNQADEQHAKTIIDGTSRIGYMDGGEAARWTDEEMPDTFLKKALTFIEKNEDGPFFLFYATHENHVPRIPHPRFLGSTSLGVRGDAVVQMDWGIGELVAKLDELGILENTLIIFSSDNGPVLFDGYYDGALELNRDHRPAGPYRGGKYSAWEGGTRAPMIVSWPEKIPSGMSDAIIGQVDFLATLAAITGADIPEGEASDSVDLVAAFTGQSEIGRESIIQQGIRCMAIRKGPWKYIPPGEVTNRTTIGLFRRDPIPEPGVLFYLPEDPEEMNNLAQAYPAKVDELKALLDDELNGYGKKDPNVDELGGAVQK
jgi:arylsulfatase A